MTDLVVMKWVGTISGVGGALLIAAHIPASGYGFLLFLLSSLSWSAAAWQMKEPSLLLLQGVFTLINLLGIWRWLVLA